MTAPKLFTVYVSLSGPREQQFVIPPDATHLNVVTTNAAHIQPEKLRGDREDARQWHTDTSLFDEPRVDWEAYISPRPRLTQETVSQAVAEMVRRESRSAEGRALLDLIDVIKTTGGSVEIHGVKIQRCDDQGQTY